VTGRAGGPGAAGGAAAGLGAAGGEARSPTWHAALPYRNPAELEVAACQFAEDAAKAGAALLVACDSPSLRAMRDRLDSIAEDVTWADSSGPGTNPGRMIHAISRFAARHADRPAWCLQEAAWPSRPDDEVWEVIRYEALMNLALDSEGVRVLCPYYSGLPSAVMSCAQATHPLTAVEGRWVPSQDYQGMDGQPAVPARCEEPLPPPPGDARVTSFWDDLARVRSVVSADARAAGLSASRAGDLVLAVGELIANTRAHTSGPGSLAQWATPDQVICEVRDGGQITDPLAGQLRPAPAQPGGGRGLWVVHQLCDLVQVRSGPAGTAIRVHMRLG